MKAPAVVVFAASDLGRSDAACVHTCGVVNAIADLGHRVELVVPRPSGTPVFDLAMGVTTRYTSLARAGKGVFLLMVPYLARQLMRRRVPRLYVRFGALSFVLAAVARLRPGATLMSEHNGWLAADLDILGMSPAVMRIASAVQVLDARLATQVRVVAPQLEDLLVDRGVAREKIRTIGNGTRYADADAPGSPVGKRSLVPKVGFLGGLTPWQGLETLLSAWTAVGDSARGCVLEIAGDGPFRHELEALSARLGLGEEVRFIGEVRPDAVLDVLRSWDVGVVTMTAAKAAAGVSSLKLREYAAAGLPAVVPDLPGFTDSSTLGWVRLYRHDDPNDLSAVLSALLADDVARQDMGKEAQAYARENFSWAHTARQIADVFGL